MSQQDQKYRVPSYIVHFVAQHLPCGISGEVFSYYGEHGRLPKRIYRNTVNGPVIYKPADIFANIQFSMAKRAAIG